MKDSKPKNLKSFTFKKLFVRSPPLLLHFTVYIIFLIICLYCSKNLQLKTKIKCFFGGLFLQSWIEYISHAYLFHVVLWKQHKAHHLDPNDQSKLIVPLGYSLSFAAITWSCLTTLFGYQICASIIVGCIIGYCAFDYIHFAMHCRNETLNKILNLFPIWHYLKNNHKKHHYWPEGDMTDGSHFKLHGFTSPLWDFIFQTYDNGEYKVKYQQNR